MFGMVALFAGVLGISAFMVTDLSSDDTEDEGETDTVDEDGEASGFIDIDLVSEEALAEDQGTEDQVTDAEPDATDTAPETATDDTSDSDTGDDPNDDPLVFTAAELATSPAALDDFSVVDDFTEITAGDGDTVNFTMPEDSGTLYVLPADYSESASSDDGDEAYTYSGYNVYYIPEGQSFPEDYEWSEEGAALYNSETYAQDDEDFEDIHLVARIDSGYTATETSYEEGTETVFDNRLGTPEVTANCNVVWGL